MTDTHSIPVDPFEDLDTIYGFRFCDACGRKMIESYCIDDGRELYCSEDGLHQHYTDEDFEQMYADYK